MADNKSKNIRQSSNLLPSFFRTEKNIKFLSSTIDQLIKTPALERIDGFVGSKLSKNYNPSSDVYIPESLPTREKYQLEPALVLKNIDGSVKAAYGYDDLINQISYYGGNVENLDRLFRPKYNSYNPQIDWDKFINFREYYWLPTGPDAVLVAGVQRNAVSTYTVTDTDDGNFFIFTPDGLTPDPLLTFYRGITYVFNIKSKHKLYFKTTNVDGLEGQYTHNVSRSTIDKDTEQLIITVDGSTPSVLFYNADDNQLAGGRILVKTILENSKIDVDKEIVGKVTYTSANGVEFINGLKVRFVGNVIPSTYIGHDYIVEGVGDQIKLVDYSELTTPVNLNTIYDTNFDGTPFDDFPFDNFKNIPETPEYITINRASQDLNPWSRYNRWVHSDVIAASAKANGVAAEYPADKRAARPIIEFHPNIQLWNFGTTAIPSIDYIDNITTDAFSNVEGAYGYYVDGNKLEDGNRVIFNADPDPMVQGKIYEVGISVFQGKQKIRLTEVVVPTASDVVVIRSGDQYQGTSWWSNGTLWIKGQQREGLNQAPVFDLFDRNGHSYSDPTYYNAQFFGNKIFGYGIGTGANDSVLGFPLQYVSDSITTVGSYLFVNYFNSESIVLVGTADPVPTYQTYLRINQGMNQPTYSNVWTSASEYQIPVLQFQVTDSAKIEVTVFDNPVAIVDLTLAVFVNDSKQVLGTDYTISKEKNKLYVVFNKTSLNASRRVLFKCYTTANANSTGIYETPLNLTNNPLNGQITSFTLSEITDHVKSMVDRDPAFVGSFPGVSNLKSLPNITQYGTRLISNQNSLAFAQCFITDAEHNLINAARKVATDYYQFKLNLLKFISQVPGDIAANQVVDQALSAMNQNKNSSFPYAHSDMIGYGDNNITSTYTVTDYRNKDYSITSAFSNTALSDRSVLVYITSNGITEQLVYGKDYDFPAYEASVHIIKDISKGDIIEIKDYFTTVGSYVPQTPTKLGLYPKYEPAILIDDSYANGPQKVIQGHDGSLTIAFSKPGEANDYRDLALLEFETRIYNNIKVSYDPGLINIHDILPSAYRTQEYTYEEINTLVRGDFIKWASTYGLDFSTNSAYDVNNHKTYNFKSIKVDGTQFPGNWRAIYKLYFDTDRPNTHPWEMLGFSIKPTWWEEEYGPGPYTAGNLNMWEDLEAGLIRQGDRAGVDPTYVRPGLSQVIPVDDSGNIIDVREWSAISQIDNILNTDQDWTFGDQGPVETTWRRSSLWPFAMQIIMALTKPADYAAMMYDVSRLQKDVSGQYNYGTNELFLNPSDVAIYTDTDLAGNIVLAAGYGVWVVENGKQRSSNYLETLKNDLNLLEFNLFYKAGGFLSKDKLEIVIDSLSPTTPNPGVLLPNEDYTLHFNVSAPVKSVAISGIIIEKKNAQFMVKGYDKRYPYFIINKPEHKSTTAAVTVGGKSETFLIWKENSFYQIGQIVQYLSKFYRVTSSHNSGTKFTVTYYNAISQLPITGGVSVLGAAQFETAETVVPYGTRYSTLQEVYDLIVGYGHWLVTQGFTFDEFNSDLGQVLDWNFSGKEFLYWTTQNWSVSSVITLSPFANTIKYQFKDSVVDNVFDSFYEYSLLRANGQPFPNTNFRLSREDGVCTIVTKNTADGLFFARLNLVQKEHALVMNNKSMFNDVIYDTETGYRQTRIKLSGFRTAEWNGEFISPGFVYDDAQISEWSQYTDYQVADIVRYVGNYYSAITNIPGATEFDFNSWQVLSSKPSAQLLPNFDYKINQFEDFYSLDIDNFDAGQQKMAQHLTGYTPREYLDNIFVNPIAQYKFYQGFIKEKGTRNAIDKLAKASIHNLQGQIDFREEWAFRVGSYGNFTSYNELEFPLREADFRENSQIVKFVDTAPVLPNDVISYIVPTDITIQSDTYTSDTAFATYSSSTYKENNMLMPHAGYVRTDDVTATAYNKNSLLDIANNGSIQEGDNIWLGFRDDGQWDVYRYTVQQPHVISSAVTTAAKYLTFTTDKFHNLSVGEIVSIYGLDNDSDGVYIIREIPSLTTFVVDTTLGTVTPNTTSALIYKFVSVRVDQFDNISKLQNTITFKPNDLVWVDSVTPDGNGTWAVYQKANNYATSAETIPWITSDRPNQDFGYKIATYDTATVVVISEPSWPTNDEVGSGRIQIYGLPLSTSTILTSYDLGMSGVAGARFGESIIYDNSTDIVVAGAPGVEKAKAFTFSRSSLDSYSEIHSLNLSNPNTGISAGYGSSLYMATPVSTDSKNKVLFVGAPGVGYNGTVYVYNLTLSSSNLTKSNDNVISSPEAAVNDKFGYAISGNKTGTRVAISAPGTNNNTGTVYVFFAETSSTTYTYLQTITNSACKTDDKFGSSVLMSEDGTYLFAASTSIADGKTNSGKVFVYKHDTVTDQYVLNQTLDNPSNDANLNFGHALSLDNTGKMLVVSGRGDNKVVSVTFDNDTTLTTFDGNSCQFGDTAKGSGAVYIFNRVNDKFIYAEELFDNNTLSIDPNTGNPEIDTRYGQSIAINSGNVFVGAPGKVVNGDRFGSVYSFAKKDQLVNSWNVYRAQDDTIDLTKVKRAITIDTLNQKTVDYLDIIDPVKGRIVGIADQEIRYKTAFDPATYSIGVQGVVVDTDTSWIEEHLGELWWDLSTVKYTWYEQGDLEYRKNSWGKLFPGASIDVYEWVSSEYLPSQWSALADTVDGLTKGISGQPKYPDNSVISVKQYYNATTGGTTNVYFYWVKNKVTVPTVDSRKISANEVARLIFNPAAYGMKYISVLDNNAISVTNVTDTLSQNNIYLNIAKDEINNDVNQHTEWMLLADGDPNRMPGTLLDKKLIDSLLGRDSVGNLVPDPTLSDRVKYGVQIRPRQSLFKDRIAALRNIIDYTNTVLSKYTVTDFINFKTLNSKDPIPGIETREYDIQVDNEEGLYAIVTNYLKTAAMTCEVTNGRISNVIITDPGFGYTIAPTVEIQPQTNFGYGAVITTDIDSNGSIIKATISEAGEQYDEIDVPRLEVRAYTVIVTVDATSKNLWTKYQWVSGAWVRVHTQDFDTTKFWDYVDWQSSSYDSLKPLSATIEQTYLLDTLDLAVGDYVKIKNQGNGRYIILSKVLANGTFDDSHDLMYSEKGTIKLKEALWNTTNSSYNFDYVYTYDQTLYDQSSEKELEQILLAIKEDIFVGPLQVYWNKLFFKAVRYAMSEQIFLDWAFKTSFINVRNIAGELDQRPVYKFQNSQFYEDYLNEVKPYHTKIRNFQVDYSIVDPTQSYTTDFDLPAMYDKNTNKFVPIELGDIVLDSYPRKGWSDNYKLSVDSIVVADGGAKYTTTPAVTIIPASGDVVTTATAIAYISLGKIIEVEVTNPGSGYTKTPTVVVSGGGGSDVTHARLSARLVNGKVRSNTVGLKFDRISKTRNIADRRVTDQFNCNGNTYKFNLTWAAENKKSNIEITLDGIRVLAIDYNIVTYSVSTNGYNKLYSRVELTYTPPNGQVLEITYNKNINLYNAIDRVQDYYYPTEGMLGDTSTAAQVMYGIDYPGTQLQTLPFAFKTGWNSTDVFTEVPWDLGTSLEVVVDNGGTEYMPEWKTITTASSAVTIIADPADTIITTATAIAYITNGAITSIKVTNHGKGYLTTPSILIQVPYDVDNGSTATAHVKLISDITAETTLDTVLDGGDLAYTLATGLNPEDMIVDGDTFISPNVSHGPEELVPGEIRESLAISVYTRVPSGSPMISQSIIVVDNTLTSTTASLSMLPPNTSSVMVSYNNRIINYGTDYTLDINAKTITLSTQTAIGAAGVTIVGVGGTGLAANEVATVSNTSSITISSGVPNIVNVGSVYATLNGRTLTSAEYTLNKKGFTVKNLDTAKTYTLQVWFFESAYKGFSEVKEQLFVTSSAQTSYTLEQPPGNIGPVNSQAIVELNKKRLVPPHTAYYSAVASQLFYEIDPNNDYPAGVFDLAALQVFVNGIQIRNGIDFILDQPNKQIEFFAGFLSTGDVVAITNRVYSDWYFSNGNIYLTNRISIPDNGTLKVITYTNHDSNLIRTEVFIARTSRRYPMNRAIYNDDYVWVTIGGNPLVNGLDYYIDTDHKTVIIDDNYPFNSTDMVQIMSMTDVSDTDVIGYRIFKDILNRTHYKRLSEANSTRLSAPLYTTSTAVYVENAAILPTPYPDRNIPGVILVAGERIEYMDIDVDNGVLHRIKRATLGTGASAEYPVGTQVMDQGIDQNLPYKETTNMVQTTATVGVKTYTINNMQIKTGNNVTATFVTTTTNLQNLAEVYYGGTLLRKDGIYQQDTTVLYDHVTCNISTTTVYATPVELPVTSVIGTAYVVTATNQVWVYTDSNESSSVKGYVYRGLNYYPPEFTITTSTTKNVYLLNLAVAPTTSTTRITLVQHTGGSMYDSTTESLLTDAGAVATFLRDSQAALPDKYHYGQL